MEDTLLALDWILFIHYLVWFKNNEVWALINSDNEVNSMTLSYIAKLGLKIRHTDARAQKIDSSIFETFKMILANFQVEDK